MVRAPVLLILAGVLGLGVGCWLDELQCTPADTTYSCCVKQHPTTPHSCGAGTAEVETATRGGLSGVGMAVGTLVAAATISSDDEVLPAKTQATVEKVLRECAEKAHEAVNRKHFGGDPTWAQCAEVVERDARGIAITTQELEANKVLVELGEWPEVDGEMPAYRQLARVLEPYLYREAIPFLEPPEMMRRWERRFLD